MAQTKDKKKRPLRVIILNQYFYPDVASTGQLLYTLSQGLVDQELDVKVLTSMPSYGPPETWVPCPKRENDHGIEIIRIRTTRFSKDNLLGRIFNSATFILPLFLRILFNPRQGDIHLYTTNPPYLGAIGAIVSKIRRHPYAVLLHDSYPHLAVWTGKISNKSIITKLWHRLNKSIYGRSKNTIVLCDAAKKLLKSYYSTPSKNVHVIPNWANGEQLNYKNKHDCDFAKKYGLVDHFTLIYSGNLGLYYDFDSLLEAATQLKGEPYRFVFIGSGGKKSWIEKQIKERLLTNTLLLPYQPIENLNDSLNSGDVSGVTIAKGIEGISFPSKLYSSLAIGKPIIALSENNSDLKKIIQDDDAGMWFELGDTQGLIEGLRSMRANPEKVKEMGINARNLFNKKFTRDQCVASYAHVLKESCSA